MRWASFAPADGRPRAGVVVGDRIHAAEAGVAMVDLLAAPGGLAEAARRLRDRPSASFSLAEVRLLAPVPRPPSVRDFSAFEAHVRAARAARGLDVDPDWYELAVFYFSNPAAVVGPDDELAAPEGCQELDFELEVAAVIGAGGADLDPAAAAAHIAGYTVMNDWSARDLQRREMRLGLGPAKGKDFATSLGPFLVTPDELEPSRSGGHLDLAMTARVNGRECSRASLAEMRWSFAELVSHASRATRVVPGDVIGSGACGTGCLLEVGGDLGPDRPRWLQPGDEVALEVGGLGTLTNRVVASRPSGQPRS